MDRRGNLALRLSYDLAGITDRGAYLDAMIQSLGMIFPSDSNGWVGAHLVTHEMEIRGTNGSDKPEYAEGLMRNAKQHPMFTSYMEPRSDISPRRISDVLSDRSWRSHPIYSEMFVPLGAEREMTIVVAPVSPVLWNGWGFHRATIDFTDREIEWAKSLQPLLMTFNRLSCLATAAAPTDHRQLTDRETQVLQLVAQGFTAAETADILRISALTVRKHLEHVYEKLGEHDRVRAIRSAIRQGIISG
jgi:DNA-binding CsgD family transcriptional regulator